MDNKTIIIQTNTKKKGRLDQRSFTCQILQFENTKVYVLDKTKNDLTRMRFTLTEGCRIIDDGICYPIQDIYFSSRPMRPHLVVSTELTI